MLASGLRLLNEDVVDDFVGIDGIGECGDVSLSVDYRRVVW